MLEVICDGHCPLFGQGECELELFPGNRPPTRCPRYAGNKSAGKQKDPFPQLW